MESNKVLYSQLFLRIAISFSFLSAVADRLGLWGAPNTQYVNWGNWQNFVDYSNSVNSFVPTPLGNILAVIATALEIIIPLFLLIGYKTKLASLASGTLLLLFGLMMTISFGIKPSLDYSVWTSAGASFLLSQCNTYWLSMDNVMENRG